MEERHYGDDGWFHRVMKCGCWFGMREWSQATIKLSLAIISVTVAGRLAWRCSAAAAWTA
jgi:hypothetical protein